MSRPVRGPADADAIALDLHAFADTLASLLPTLLFTRDRDSLVRWCRARSWVDNALSGELVPDLPALAVAVGSLALRASDATGTAHPEPGE